MTPEMIELLGKFYWNYDNMKELLETALKEHGTGGLHSCLEIALEF